MTLKTHRYMAKESIPHRGEQIKLHVHLLGSTFLNQTTTKWLPEMKNVLKIFDRFIIGNPQIWSLVILRYTQEYMNGSSIFNANVKCLNIFHSVNRELLFHQYLLKSQACKSVRTSCTHFLKLIRMCWSKSDLNTVKSFIKLHVIILVYILNVGS